MLQPNWKKQSTTMQLERVELPEKIKTIMPENILMKIKYLCRAIPKVEWSGILFYSVKGSIVNPEKMIITIEDIIPMDKGVPAYTEYQYNEKKRDMSGYEDKMIDYVNAEIEKGNEQVLDWKFGHIHSHNSMNVFFSGTDMEELNDNSASHNFYTSLIVNNWMDFSAKVAFRAETKADVEADYVALDENGNRYVISQTKLNIKKEKLYIYDCEIEVPETSITVNKSFSDNVLKIIKEAEKPVVTHYQQNKRVQTNNTHKVKPRQTGFTPQGKVNQTPSNKLKDVISDIPFDTLETDVNLFDNVDELSDAEYFTISLLRGTNPPSGNESVVTALEEIDAFIEMLTPEEISKNILDNYPALFEQQFEQIEDDEQFMDITQEVIEILEEYETDYTFLSKTILALKYMLYKFEENATTV